MERVWLSRLRWRLRGAWQWPSFVALTLADAVLLHQVPIAGEGPDWIPAVLLAMFFNLLAVAVAGPLLGIALRRRRPDLPRVVATDYGGTAALVATSVLLAGIGLAHRPARQARHDAFAAQSAAVRRYVARTAGVAPEYRRTIDRADTVHLGGDLYRTCVPGDDPERPLCLFIDTGTSPPGVREDPSRSPNSTYVPYGGP
jgi:hypothetical protein